MSKDVSFLAGFSAKELKAEGQGLSVVEIEGIALDTSVNRNRWFIAEEDLDSFAASMVGRQLRVDHSLSVAFVKGKVLDAKRDGSVVRFKAEVSTHDPNVAVPVLRGYVNTVSVGVRYAGLACRECKASASPAKTCEHASAAVRVMEPRCTELSLVTDPAYPAAKFQPNSFFAALDKTLESEQTMADPTPAAPAAAPAAPDLTKFGESLIASVKDALAASAKGVDEKLAALKADHEKAISELKASKTPEPKPLGAGLVASETAPPRPDLFASAFAEMQEAVTGKRPRGQMYKVN